MITFSEISKCFHKIETPKYLDTEIKKIAVSYMGYSDVGMIRKTYDAELFLKNLSEDFRTEYAFEKFLGLNFDWEKRNDKNYNRLQYCIDGTEFQLVQFSSTKMPITKFIKPSILIYTKPEKFIYIGGLICLNDFYKGKKIENSITETGFNLFENEDFKHMKYFSSLKELLELILNK